MTTLPKCFNTVAGATPYKDLFTKVAIVPANCSLAFISTQFACDAETGELPVGMEGDYAKQSAKIWEQVVGILKELGVTMKEVVHVTVNFGLVLPQLDPQLAPGILKMQRFVTHQ
jgi:enamine deaminase RidA (YjgF/YER057c/UK114 family)